MLTHSYSHINACHVLLESVCVIMRIWNPALTFCFHLLVSSWPLYALRLFVSLITHLFTLHWDPVMCKRWKQWMWYTFIGPKVQMLGVFVQTCICAVKCFKTNSHDLNFFWCAHKCRQIWIYLQIYLFLNG